MAVEVAPRLSEEDRAHAQLPEELPQRSDGRRRRLLVRDRLHLRHLPHRPHLPQRGRCRHYEEDVGLHRPVRRQLGAGPGGRGWPARHAGPLPREVCAGRQAQGRATARPRSPDPGELPRDRGDPRRGQSGSGLVARGVPRSAGEGGHLLQRGQEGGARRTTPQPVPVDPHPGDARRAAARTGGADGGVPEGPERRPR